MRYNHEHKRKTRIWIFGDKMPCIVNCEICKVKKKDTDSHQMVGLVIALVLGIVVFISHSIIGDEVVANFISKFI